MTQKHLCNTLYIQHHNRLENTVSINDNPPELSHQETDDIVAKAQRSSAEKLNRAGKADPPEGEYPTDGDLVGEKHPALENKRVYAAKLGARRATEADRDHEEHFGREQVAPLSPNEPSEVDGDPDGEKPIISSAEVRLRYENDVPFQERIDELVRQCVFMDNSEFMDEVLGKLSEDELLLFQERCLGKGKTNEPKHITLRAGGAVVPGGNWFHIRELRNIAFHDDDYGIVRVVIGGDKKQLAHTACGSQAEAEELRDELLDLKEADESYEFEDAPED